MKLGNTAGSVLYINSVGTHTVQCTVHSTAVLYCNKFAPVTFAQCCGARAGEDEIISDVEPEPKIFLNKYFKIVSLDAIG